MKKKIVIPIIIFLVVIIGIIVGVLLLNKGNQKDLTIITLDINPSIELTLDKEKKIVDVKALNDDAKDVISNDVKGKELREGLSLIVDKLIEKDYTRDNYVDVILYKEGQIDHDYIIDEVTEAFRAKGVDPHLAIIEEVTKEDKKLAKKYGITPAKAAYINGLIKENDNFSFEELSDKPISEMKEMAESGYYCEEGYKLEGSNCSKEVSRTPAKSGKVCPNGYVEANGKCYLEGRHSVTDNYYCGEEFTLDGNECVRTIEGNAEPVEWECTTGEKSTKGEMGLVPENNSEAHYGVCVDMSKATHPVSPCELNDGTEWTKANGKCYWHRAPVIDTGCPGKLLVNGECWDDASNILICKGARDGKQYKSRDEICEGSIKILDAVVTKYKCEDGFELSGNKCTKEERGAAMVEFVCEDGSEKVNDRCVYKDKTTEMVDGYVCDERDTRVVGNECIHFEIKDAMKR